MPISYNLLAFTKPFNFIRPILPLNPQTILAINERLRDRLLKVYAKNVMQDFQSLEEGFKAQSAKSVFAMAHKISGASGITGADKVAELSSEIEKLSVDGLLKIESLITDLENEVQRVVEFIETERYKEHL